MVDPIRPAIIGHVPIERPSRRAVLVCGLAVGGVLSGCLPGPDEDEPERARESAGRLQLRGIIEDAERLAAQYQAVQLRFPDPTGMLVLFASEHRAHAEALRELVSPRVVASSSRSASTTTRSHHLQVEVRATTAQEARAQLVTDELAASKRRAEAAARAAPRVARLLASISASNAVHAALLEAQPA